MKKLTVFIEDDKKELNLDESLVINKDSYIYVKTVSIYWNYNNVYSGYNDEIYYGSRKVTFDQGYWTFELMKKKLELLSGNIKVIKNVHNNTYTITTDSNLQLKRFGELIGFDNNTTINANTTKSGKNIDINSKLRYIKNSCDAVDRTCNNDNTGKRSPAILTLPITTKESLKGSVTHFTDIESKIPINKGVYNKLCFDVITNNNKTHHGSTLMELQSPPLICKMFLLAIFLHISGFCI